MKSAQYSEMARIEKVRLNQTPGLSQTHDAPWKRQDHFISTGYPMQANDALNVRFYSGLSISHCFRMVFSRGTDFKNRRERGWNHA